MSVTDIREIWCKNDTKDILGTLDRLREKVISGEVTGIMVIAEQPERRYMVVGSGCYDSRSFAGALLELAIRRLGFAYRFDDNLEGGE